MIMIWQPVSYDWSQKEGKWLSVLRKAMCPASPVYLTSVARSKDIQRDSQKQIYIETKPTVTQSFKSSTHRTRTHLFI